MRTFSATVVVHVVAIVMVAIMLRHVRSKYTAIGRREISVFFNLYLMEEGLGIILDSAIVPTGSAAYGWMVAVHVGLVLASAWCLLANGIVGFRLWEDGTRVSVAALTGTTLVMFGAGFIVAAATFRSWSPAMTPKKQLGLFVVHLVAPVVLVIIWLTSQIFLVLRTLDTLWPLGDLCFAAGFYIAALILMLIMSPEICNGTEHFVDGLFFGVLSILLSVMMVYKFWDDITKEDLEFSVGAKLDSWEVKDPVFFTPNSLDTFVSN